VKHSILLVCVLVVAGCISISTGANFDVSKVGSIQKGVTTSVEIVEWFGSPYSTGVDNGDEAWTYSYLKSASGQTMSKTLYLVFDKAMKVKNYTFSTSFPEEMTSPK